MIKQISIIGLLVSLFIVAEPSYGQVPSSQIFRLGEGIIRIAEAGELVDSVNVWGAVNNPGRYIVPQGTYVHELISYARGPSTLQMGSNIPVEWSKMRIEVNISEYNPVSGQNTVETFRYRYNEPYPAELREFQVSNDQIISLEFKRRAGLPDILGVVAPTVSAIATTILIFQRL